MESITSKLFVLLGVLINLKTQFADLCNNLLNQLVQLLLKVKAYLANLITQVQSIKAVLTNVQAKVGDLGKQIQTIVVKTPLLATLAAKLKVNPAALISLVQSNIQKLVAALILMATQLKDNGLKLLNLVSQLQQRVIQVFKKGN
jgi:hypothetical protein